ncbi:YdeI/OmpD-associated family protein [Salana multivorans]
MTTTPGAAEGREPTQRPGSGPGRPSGSQPACEPGPQPGRPGGTDERPAVFFVDAAEFRLWLELNHATAPELWMGLHGRHVTPRGLTWQEAVLEALCFGWIDSISQSIDSDARRQRWTPRRPGSVWSAVNVAHVERLTAEGRMHPAGLAAFERRRPDRTGAYSYERASDLGPEQLTRLRLDPGARAFWEAATPGYRKVATYWVTSAKREVTREQRLETLVACCREGVLIPPQRYGDVPRWVESAAAAARTATGSA